MRFAYVDRQRDYTNLNFESRAGASTVLNHKLLWTHPLWYLSAGNMSTEGDQSCGGQMVEVSGSVFSIIADNDSPSDNNISSGASAMMEDIGSAIPPYI